MPVYMREKTLYNLIAFSEVHQLSNTIKCEMKLLIGFSGSVMDGVFKFHGEEKKDHP